jgi:light-regulated signal transduction histidine kinase (bacteriophytochrome)
LGRRELERRDTDHNVVLSDVVDSHQARLDDLGVEVRAPHPLPTVACDATLVGEVLQNLITNAMKYNDKEDGRWVEVDSGLETSFDGEPRHVIRVRDNGIGVPEKHRESIFRIFKRLHGRDKFGGGHGAGLTIVKKIVQRHGGRVWVDSTPGEGSTFHFTLQEG